MSVTPIQRPFPTIRLANAASRLPPLPGPPRNTVGLESIASGLGRLTDKPWLDSSEPGNLYCAGEILYGKLRPYLAKIWLADRSGNYIGDFIRMLPANNFRPHFLKYTLLTSQFTQAATIAATGTKMPRTEWASLKDLTIPCPPVDLQDTIADYLDHETAEIDAFINDQTTFSELLSERDITTMALVRESNSYSAPLRRFGSITLGKMVPSTRAGEAALSGLIMQPYLRAASVQPQGLLVLDENIKEMPFTPTESRNLTLHRNDVVVVEGGAGFGRSAVLDRDLHGWGFQNSINRIRLFPNAADPYFIHYNLQLMLALGELDIVVNQATIPHLTAEKLASCPIAYRPLEQQEQISCAIRSELDRNNALRADIQASIALARERRTALITAAVTGQIDVTARNKPAAEQLEDDIAQGLHREN